MSPIKAALPKGMGEKKLESKWRKKCYFDGKDPDVWNRSFHLVIFQPSSFPKNFPALDLVRTNNNRDLLP